MTVQIYHSLFKANFEPINVGEKYDGDAHVAVVIKLSSPSDVIVLTEEMEDRLLQLIQERRERNERNLGIPCP